MAVTLRDIAERTGVSPSVVSTVLSGRDNGTFVSESTRQKVLQVAESLNYTPVRSGRPRGSRRLRRQRTEQFIGIWDPDYSPHTAQMIHHLQIALRQYAETSGAEAEDDFGLRLLTPEDLPRLDAIGIMGMLLLSPVPLPREAAAATIPSVLLGELENPPRELVQVHLDNLEAGRLVGDYLWELGHRRIGFLARQAHEKVSQRRLTGLQEAWQLGGGDPANVGSYPYDTVKTLGPRDAVRHAILALFGPEAASGNRPTALVCYDESVAAVAAQTLAELGVRVPAEVSLIGFEDTPNQAESAIPALTTVRAPLAEIATETIGRLYLLHESEMPEELEPRDIAFSGELIRRASCAAPQG